MNLPLLFSLVTPQLETSQREKEELRVKYKERMTREIGKNAQLKLRIKEVEAEASHAKRLLKEKNTR